MKTNRIIYMLFLGAYLALSIGCTSLGAEKKLIQEDIAVLNGDVPDSAILSEISNMKAGEKRLLGEMTFMVGKDYAAASGVRCKPVVITETMHDDSAIATNRLACKFNNKWLFSKNVFLTDL